MVGKNWFFLLIFLVVLTISNVNAYTCDLRLASNCNSAPFNNILMKVSALTNAHGEVYTQPNQYALCCDFAYTKPVSCKIDGAGNGILDNRVLGLFSPTNAHAEVPNPATITYNTDVCYENLECVHTSNPCSGDYPIEMLSLSDTTNAHIASYGTAGYPINICCKDVTDPAQSNCPYNVCQAGDLCLPDPPGFVPALDTPYCCQGTCCAANFGAEICLNKVCGSYTNSCGQTFVCGDDTKQCSVDYRMCNAIGAQTCNLATGQWNTECTGTTDPRQANCAGKRCGTDGCGGVCGTCPAGNSCDAGQCVSDNTPCIVTSAGWDRASANQGDLVNLEVIGNSDCAGDSVSFVVWEEDLTSPDDPVTTNPANANFVFNGSHYKANGLWNAEWQADADEPPEYYFRTMTISTGLINESGDGSGTIRLLSVNKGGIPPVCTANLCSDYTNEADCSSNPCGADIIDAEALLRYGEVCGGSCPDPDGYYSSCSCYWDISSNTCEFQSSFLTCQNPCGNDVVNAGEECDGTDLNGAVCEDYDGLAGGAAGMSCNADCTLNTSLCSGGLCNNNGIQETGEECDGNDFSSKPGGGSYTCFDYDDYDDGDLSCTSNCKINTNGCTTTSGYGPGTDIGNCSYSTTSLQDCDAGNGIYTATFGGTWMWATMFNSSAECINAGYVDCYQDVSGDGKWHYDPTNGQQKGICTQGKTKSMECPADIALPFFTPLNILITLLTIATIYGLIALDRKKKDNKSEYTKINV